MKFKIALLAGDGIGPEVINEAVKVSDAIAKKFNHEITWTHNGKEFKTRGLDSDQTVAAIVATQKMLNVVII